MGTSSRYTLYAVWEIITYDISYVLGGGANNSGNPTKYNVNSDTVTLKAPTRAGYTFNGWYTDANFSNKCSTIPAGSTGDITLYASWTPNVNTVVFNSNGGSGSMGSLSLSTDETTALPNSTFTRDGYTFIGWATSEAGSVVYEDGATYTMGTNSAYTLYAIWSANENRVIFNSNGGVGDMGAQVIKTGATASLNKCTLERHGYTFIGWSTSPTGSVVYKDGDTYTMGAESEYTLYAVWEYKEVIFSWKLI